MKTTFKNMGISAALALVFALAVLVTPRTAGAQEYWEGDVPPAYVATVEPVYFGGRAHYWYHNHWMWRDGGRWRYYHTEPAYFRDWRARYPRGHWGYWRR